ncbi:MAG: isoprenylcysteine carboxylmethyltransferase family protein [Nitrospirae bacterium]|nr:isoprenylcysteine carboxylmethyltransferase family protein [Nitrospirota bacterium]
MIRTWASGFIKKDKELAQEGPYALTRNPLYLGNFLIGLGFSIMACIPILLTLFLLAFSLIYIFTIRNEEKSLSAKFGDTYSAYKSRVPVFFPLRIIPDQRDFSLNFDWQLIWKHREHHTWLGIFGCLIIFILKLYLPSLDGRG